MWERYTAIFLDSFAGYGRYLRDEITHPSLHGYFYGLILVSLAVYALELHINHANFRPPIGPLRYIFNSPQMHIWHHAKELPARYGANYGLSLSVWDWIFGTVHWPHSGRDIPLGFSQVEEYPERFLPQMVVPFREST